VFKSYLQAPSDLIHFFEHLLQKRRKKGKSILREEQVARHTKSTKYLYVSFNQHYIKIKAESLK
jgi:transposase